MYAVGLEGGGSHTYVVVVDLAQKKIVGRTTHERSSNRYVLGLERALTVMHEAVLEALKPLGLGLADLRQVGITASGFNAADPAVNEFFARLGYPKTVSQHDTDGPAVAYQLQYHRPCCVLIAGTGSASKVFAPRGTRLLSAYGHELNECGAAYSAVRRFVNRVLDEFDWDDQSSRPAWELFCAEMGINTDPRHNDLLDLFYGTNKQKIASFARTMTKLAGEHPVFMESLLAEAGCVARLVRCSCAAYRALGGEGTLPIIKIGGFWNCMREPAVRAHFERELAGADVQLLDCHADAAAVGAALTGIEGEYPLNLFE